MPAFKYRAVMLDAARVIQRPAYFHLMLPWLKEWGYNVLHLHLTDDQGCAMVFPRHPELASRGAMTVKQMQGLVAEADRLGLQVMPELETFGHTRFITRLPQYQSLGVGPRGRFNAIDPDSPAACKILADLVADLAAIFPSPLIHAGLDEVNLSALPRYRDAGPEQLRAVYARHAAWVHEEIRRVGKRPAMWGDHIQAAPGISDGIKRDVLLCVWEYRAGPEPINAMETLCRQGFEIWGVPSVSCWPGVLASCEDNFINLRQFSASALPFRTRGLSGMVNTVWCPWRYLSGAMDWPICLGGHLFSAAREDPDRCRDFCREFFGLASADARRCAGWVGQLHGLLPRRNYRIPVWGHWRQAGAQTFNREDRRLGSLLAVRADAVALGLAKLLPRARRNADHLGDLVATAQVARRIGLFAASGRTKSALPDGRALRRDCAASWRRDRLGPWRVPGEDPSDNLMAILDRLV